MGSLERHFETTAVAIAGGARLVTKPGVRGHPDPPPGLEVLLERVEAGPGVTVDATGSAGGFALGAGLRGGATVYEPSRASALCALDSLRGTGVEVRAGAIWDAPPGGANLVALLPPADRGNARVAAELAGAARALRPGGRVVFALHRDLGAKRYQRWADRWFETSSLGKRSGWRVVEGRLRAGPGGGEGEWLEFAAAGFELVARPGVFAAGRLDPGSERLLGVLQGIDVAGARVLDLGCGYGILALEAARSGGVVTAADDDWPAVESARGNLERNGLGGSVVHSDLTSDLERDDPFDLVLCNPPFHVGKGVRMDVPAAFIEAARVSLRRGGELLLVANRALPYERPLSFFTRVDTVLDEGGFRVYRARR